MANFPTVWQPSDRSITCSAPVSGTGTVRILWSAGLLSLAEAILIAQLSPILMAIGAVFILSERLTFWRIGVVLIGFAGVLVLVWPERGGANSGSTRLFGIGLALVSAVLSALALIIVRSLNRIESPGAIAVYFVIASIVGALLSLPWRWVVPDMNTTVLLIFELPLTTAFLLAAPLILAGAAFAATEKKEQS